MTLAELFVQVCWMSVTALIVAVPVMVLSLIFDGLRVPKKFSCLLFALVLFRMLCPLALPSQVSLFNGAFIQDVQQQAVASLNGYSGDYEIGVEGTESYDRAVAAGIVPEPGIPDRPESFQAVFYKEVNGEILPADRAMDTWVPVLAKIWVAGMAAFYAFTLLSYLLLRRKLRFAVKLEGNVFVSDRIPSPCVVGYFRPRIYLIPGLSEAEQAHILAHERAHLRAGDHWAKLVAWLALGVHWFNLWLWSVHSVYCSQLEEACDERVIRLSDDETREAYSQTLLNLSYNRRFRWLHPVSFSEGGTKERVKNVLRYKKPNAALIVLAVMATAVLLVSCGTGGGAQQERDAPDALESADMTITDRTGTLTQEQLASLAQLLHGDWATNGGEAAYLNTKVFQVAELLDVVPGDGGTYAITSLNGNALGVFLPEDVGLGENGAVFCTVNCTCFELVLTWDGTAFQADSVLVIEWEELEDKLSETARERMQSEGIDEAFITEQLCGQAGAWYGCGAWPNGGDTDAFQWMRIDPAGVCTVEVTRDGTTEEDIYDYAALRNAGKEATDAGVTDVSDWTTEELVRALPTCDGYFTDMAATELGTRFVNDPLPVMQEITALGAEDRAIVCHLMTNYYYWWAQTFTIVDAQERIDMLDQGAEEPPAVQETARIIQAEYAAFEDGTNEDTMGDSGWAIQEPVVMPAYATIGE